MKTKTSILCKQIPKAQVQVPNYYPRQIELKAKKEVAENDNVLRGYVRSVSNLIFV